MSLAAVMWELYQGYCDQTQQLVEQYFRRRGASLGILDPGCFDWDHKIFQSYFRKRHPCQGASITYNFLTCLLNYVQLTRQVWLLSKPSHFECSFL